MLNNSKILKVIVDSTNNFLIIGSTAIEIIEYQMKYINICQNTLMSGNLKDIIFDQSQNLIFAISDSID